MPKHELMIRLSISAKVQFCILIGVLDTPENRLGSLREKAAQAILGLTLEMKKTRSTGLSSQVIRA